MRRVGSGVMFPLPLGRSRYDPSIPSGLLGCTNFFQLDICDKVAHHRSVIHDERFANEPAIILEIAKVVRPDAWTERAEGYIHMGGKVQHIPLTEHQARAYQRSRAWSIKAAYNVLRTLGDKVTPSMRQAGARVLNGLFETAEAEKESEQVFVAMVASTWVR
jgi:hypothetical protein